MDSLHCARTEELFSMRHLLILYSSVSGKNYLLNYMWVMVLLICYVKYEIDTAVVCYFSVDGFVFL